MTACVLARQSGLLSAGAAAQTAADAHGAVRSWDYSVPPAAVGRQGRSLAAKATIGGTAAAAPEQHAVARSQARCTPDVETALVTVRSQEVARHAVRVRRTISNPTTTSLASSSPRATRSSYAISRFQA